MMFIRSFAVLLLSAMLLVGNPVFGGQLECSNDYGITLDNFVLSKDGAEVSGVELINTTYTASGNIIVTSGASVQSINAKFDMWIKITVQVLIFAEVTSNFPYDLKCDTEPCAQNDITCSKLENEFGFVDVCGSNSEILAGSYSFNYLFPVQEYPLPDGVVSASATITIQFFDSSDGAQIGCLRKVIPIIV